MSKRFGRNQRRRAREALAAAQTQIAGLQQARAMDAEVSAYARRAHDDLKEAVKFIAQQIGADHIAFPAQERGTHDDLRHGIQYDAPRPMPSAALLRADMGHDAMMSFTYQVLDLLDIERHRDQLAQRVHFFVRINSTRKLAYAVNISTLQQIPRDRLIQMMSDHLARLLAEQL